MLAHLPHLLAIELGFVFESLAIPNTVQVHSRGSAMKDGSAITPSFTTTAFPRGAGKRRLCMPVNMSNSPGVMST